MKKLILAIAIFLGASPLWAELMTYQGRLKESNIPVTGNRLFSFEFCDQEDGSGACLMAPGTPAFFAVANGLFKSTITIHPGVDLAVGTWYLRVTVGSSILTPLERLTAVPYSVFASSAGHAAYAVNAASADGTLLKAGDTMTGQLTVSGSTFTVLGPDGNANGGLMWVSTSAVTPALFVSTTGRVGVGTASPAHAIHIVNRSGQVALQVDGYDNSADSIYVNSQGSGKPGYGYTRGGLLKANTQVDTSDRLNIKVNGVERMTLTPAGFVGVNNVSPSYLFHVSTTAGETGAIMAVSTGASNLFWVEGDGAHATRFYGDGSGLTGVTGATGTDPNALQLTGGTMTGPLAVMVDPAVNSFDIQTNGITISTSGAITTSGLGLGSATANPRGRGAIDLQTDRVNSNESATGDYSVLSGGKANKSPGNFSVTGGGQNNSAYGASSALLGGENNAVTGNYSAVGGGVNNNVAAYASVVSGGQDNKIGAAYNYSAVLGGAYNTVDSNYGSVGGGNYNAVSGSNSVISGGVYNTVSGTSSVVAGGEYNVASGKHSSVGGGLSNTASSQYSAVGAGTGNAAANTYAYVGGGVANLASGYVGVVAGGASNRADGYRGTVGGGYDNRASGQDSVVPGGFNNTAEGNYSFAAGAKSSSTAQGAFTWQDSGGATLELINNVTDRTVFKSRGGFLVTGSTNTTMTGSLDRGVLITGNGLMGVATSVPQAALDVVSTGTAANVYAQIWRDSTGLVVGSVSAQGVFYGNGAGLTGLSATDPNALPLTGGTMAGALNMNGNFLDGVSTITMQNGSIAIVPPGTGGTNHTYGISIGSGAYNNYTYGVGLGNNANNNYTYGVGVGHIAQNNSNYGVGLGYGAHDNYNSGVGIGQAAAYNSDSGVGVGSNASGNDSYAVGIGAFSKDNRPYGAALGAYSYASSSATALGAQARANAELSLALGYGTVNNSTGTASFGGYAVHTSTAVNAAYYQVNGSTVLAIRSGSLAVGSGAGRQNTGLENVFVGTQAGESTQAGDYNVFLGYQSGLSNTFGYENAFLGDRAGRSNTTGQDNTLVGALAGSFNQTGSANAAFGYSAGYGVASNSFSSATLVGYKAGTALTTGSDNILIGFQAGDSVTTGGRNIIIGYDLDATASTISNEIRIGSIIYGNMATGGVGLGENNTLPAAALDVKSTGTASNVYAQIWRDSTGLVVSSVNSQGVFYGNGSGLTGVTAAGAVQKAGDTMSGHLTISFSSLTVIGDTFDSHSLAVGTGTLATHLYVSTTGAIGLGTVKPQAPLHLSGSSTTEMLRIANPSANATGMTFRGVANSWLGTVGVDSNGLYYNVPSNTSVGFQFTGVEKASVTAQGAVSAAYYQVNGSTILAMLPGVASLGVGVEAGRINTATQNTFVGVQAGYANTTGAGNSFLGYRAGYANTTGAANSFIGKSVAYSNTTGSNNTFLGFEAGLSNINGNNNAYLGNAAGYFNQTGAGNSVVGSQAGHGASGQSYSSSTLVGYQAGYNLNSSVGNILIGYQAGFSITTGTGNIVIGYDQDVYTPTDNNVLNIGGVLFGELQDKTIGINSFLPTTPVKPQAALDVISTGTAANVYAQIWRDSDGLAVSSVSAQGVFYGNGSGLRNVTAYGAVQKAGDNMTGQLTTASTITVRGDAFSVGDSTFVVKAGRVGINWITPEAALQVSGGAKFLSNAGTSYILTAGSPARPDMFFVSSGGAVGMGDFTGVSVDTAAAVQIASRLTGATNGLEDTKVGLFVESHTDGSLDSDDLLVGANLEATLRGADAPSLVSALRLKVRRESTPTGTVDRAMGLFIDDLQNEAGGTINNTYGIFIGNQSAGTQSNSPFALFSVDPNARSYFAGSVGIARTIPEARLDLAAAGLGADSMGQIWRNFDGTIVSSVSATGVMMANRFVGDGSGLINVPGVQKTGDTMTGALRLPQGTDAVPSLSFSGDENTGFYSPGQDQFAFATAGTERLRVTDAGRLGVGTPAPDAALSVVQSDVVASSYTVHIGTSVSAYHLVVTTAGWVGLNTRQPMAPLHLTAATKDEGIVVEHNSETSEGSYLALVKARGTANSQTVVQSGDNLGVLAFGGYNAAPNDPFPTAAAIVGRVDGVASVSPGTDMPGRLEFMTASDGTIETQTRMVIRNDGSVGISTGTPQAMLDIRSTATVAQIWRDAGGVARATMTASGVLYAVVDAAVQKTGDTMSGNLSINVNPAMYASDFNTTGIRISTAGSITTIGAGNGISGPGARGMGAVDLQTAREVSGHVALGDFSTLSGGAFNTVLGSNTVVAGGRYNIGAGTSAVISGGEGNYAASYFGTIGGGKGNSAYGSHSAIFSGSDNLAEEMFAFVGSGYGNTASTSYSVVAGGYNNVAGVSGGDGEGSFIGGGRNNTVNQNYGAIAGGMNNAVGDFADYAFIGGGYENDANGTHSAVAGGWWNVANGADSFVGAGNFNTVDGATGVIAGGYQNKLQSSALAAFIGGGRDNTITAGTEKAVIVGGSSNTVSGLYGFIGAGGPVNAGDPGNKVLADYSAIVGGSENLADAGSWMSFIGGGSENTVSGQQSVVAGGWMNTAGAASEYYAGVVAGWGNKALGGSSFVGAGGGNLATGDNSAVAGGSSNMATGGDSAVPGGSNNTAKGNYSFAAGYKSSSTAAGTFTWADSKGVVVENSVADQVMFKAAGGFWVSTGTAYADPALYVSNTNKVGIGTNAPGFKLHVKDLAGGAIAGLTSSPSSTDAGVYGWSNSAATAIKGVASSGYAGRFEGNVFITNDGVNPANPAKLQVNGDLGLGDGTQTGNAPVVIWLTASTPFVSGDVVIASGNNQFGTTVVASTPTVIGVAISAGTTSQVGKIAVAGVVVAKCIGGTFGQHAVTSATPGSVSGTGFPSSGTSVGIFLTDCGNPNVNQARLLLK